MATRDVLIVLFDGVQSLDVTGPLEVLAGANSWLAAAGDRPGSGCARQAWAAGPCVPPAAC